MLDSYLCLPDDSCFRLFHEDDIICFHVYYWRALAKASSLLASLDYFYYFTTIFNGDAMQNFLTGLLTTTALIRLAVRKRHAKMQAC